MKVGKEGREGEGEGGKANKRDREPQGPSRPPALHVSVNIGRTAFQFHRKKRPHCGFEGKGAWPSLPSGALKRRHT